jgi:peptide/nickel transport system substrate-binding protein
MTRSLCFSDESAKPLNMSITSFPLRALIVTIISIFGLIPLCLAQDKSTHQRFSDDLLILHGLAMHGEPALPAGFTHFPYANAEASKGGRIILGQQGSFDSLNPFIVIGVAPDTAPRFVLQSLMTRSLDEPFTLYPLLAKAVRVSPDRNNVVFEIDPSASFSDGRPVTSADVLFSFEALKTHGKPFHRSSLSRVKKANIINTKTIHFDLGGSGDRELPLILGTMPIFAAHTLSMETFKEPSLKPLIGSGPYLLEDIKPGERIVLKKRSDFWAKDLPVTRGQFNFDEIRYDYFRDANTLFEAFKTGLVDYRVESDPGRWASLYDFPRLNEGKVTREVVPNRLPKGMSGFVFNTRRPLFQDIQVREALSLMFDFEWANRNLYHGLFRRSVSYFDGADLSARNKPADDRERALLEPFLSSVRPEIIDGNLGLMSNDGSGRDRDVARKALDLLNKAGWTVRDEKLRRITGDDVFSFELLVTSRQQERLALNYAMSLSRIGIDVKVRLTDDAQFWRRLSNFDFDMIQWTWPVSPSPGNEQRNRWGSAAAARQGSLNYAGVNSLAIDTMMDAMLKSQKREDFAASIRALDRLLVSGSYVVPLFQAPDLWLSYDAQLKRPGYTPLFGPALELWWRSQPEQGRIVQ